MEYQSESISNFINRYTDRMTCPSPFLDLVSTSFSKMNNIIKFILLQNDKFVEKVSSKQETENRILGISTI